MPIYQKPGENDDNALDYACAITEAQELLSEIEDHLDGFGGISPEMVNADDISDAYAIHYHLLAISRLIADIEQRNQDREYFDEETFAQMDKELLSEYS